MIEQFCGPSDQISLLCKWVYENTGNGPLARLADNFLTRPAKVVGILLVAWVVVRLGRRGVRRFVRGLRSERVKKNLSLVGKTPAAELFRTQELTERGRQRTETVGYVLRSLISFVVWSIAILMVLGEVGINLGPLLAGAGIAGVAIGFGAQHMVRDFLSGMFMLIEDQYGVGDIVDLGHAEGVVEGVSLRTTRIRDLKGNVWYIPNGAIERVSNRSQQWARSLIDVSVAYDTDLRQAMVVIEEVAHSLWVDEEWRPRLIEEPDIWGIESLGADGIDIRLGVKTRAGEQMAVSRELRLRIKEEFDARGIEIPFPQRMIWHRNQPEGEQPAKDKQPGKTGQPPKAGKAPGTEKP